MRLTLSYSLILDIQILEELQDIRPTTEFTEIIYVLIKAQFQLQNYHCKGLLDNNLQIHRK